MVSQDRCSLKPGFQNLDSLKVKRFSKTLKLLKHTSYTYILYSSIFPLYDTEEMIANRNELHLG